MSFQGAPTLDLLVDDYTYKREGQTLDAFVATPPAIANNDTGRLTSAAPAADEDGINPDFGPGRGNWRAGDQHRVAVEIADGNVVSQGGAGQTSLVDRFALSIVNNDLVIDFFNRGQQDSGSLAITLRYRNPIQVDSATRA